MSAHSHALPRMQPLPRLFWLVLLGSAAALLDLAVASIYWGARGVSAERVFQSIASWLMGRAAFFGGDATVILGGLMYVAVVCTAMACYGVLARRIRGSGRWPVLGGAVYGAAVYLLIFLGFVPHLSAAHPTAQPLSWHLLCMAAYALLVGIPAALLARVPDERLPPSA